METGFTVIAGVSTLIFGFQLVALFFAGDGDFDFDFDGDGEVDFDLDDSDGAFKFVSLKGIVSFFMGLGWGGLLTLQQGHHFDTALFRGILFGLVYMGLSAVIYHFIQRLKQENKTNYKAAIGKQADVYLKIGPHNTGQIKVILNGKFEIVDAITQNDDVISTGSLVKITDFVNGKYIVTP